MIFVFQGVTRTRRSDDTGDFCTFEISPVQIVGFIRVVSIFSRFRPYMSWGLYGHFLRFRDFARTGYGYCAGGFEESEISPVQGIATVRVFSEFWNFTRTEQKNTAEFSWKDKKNCKGQTLLKFKVSLKMSLKTSWMLRLWTWFVKITKLVQRK